jgi:hypothetical protein
MTDPDTTRGNAPKSYTATVFLSSPAAKSAFDELRKLIDLSKTVTSDTPLRNVTLDEVPGLPMQVGDIVITDSPELANQTLNLKHYTPVIFLSSEPQKIPDNSLVERILIEDSESKTKLCNALSTGILLSAAMQETVSERIKDHVYRIVLPPQGNQGSIQPKFAAVRTQFEDIRANEDRYLSGAFYPLLRMLRDYTAALNSSDPNAHELHEKAVKHARDSGLTDYIIAKSGQGLLQRLGGEDKSEFGEGGAKGIALDVMKPLTGDNHVRQADTRYEIFKFLMNKDGHKPALHKAPLHDLEKKTSILFIEHIEGPDLIDALKQLNDGERAFTNYIEKAKTGCAELGVLANEVREKGLMRAEEKNSPLSATELSYIDAFARQIPKARTNVIKAAVTDFAHWAGRFANEIDKETGTINLSSNDKDRIVLDTPDAVKGSYVSNLASIPELFAPMLSEPFSEVEQTIFRHSIAGIIDTADWRSEFIIPYRDADFRNIKLLLETSTPTLPQLIEHCVKEDQLGQSVRHFDFGDRSCHVLEDLMHMIVTPEAQIAPKDGHRHEAKHNEMLNTMCEGIEMNASRHYAQLFAGRFGSKGQDELSPLVLAFYRCARKMGLTRHYSQEAVKMFKKVEIGSKELDSSLSHYDRMFHEYNDSARAYLDWIFRKLENASESPKEFHSIYKRIREEGLKNEDAVSFANDILAKGSLPEKAKQVAYAVYAEAFLEKLKKNFKGHSA